MRKIVLVISNNGVDRVCIYFYSAVYTEYTCFTAKYTQFTPTSLSPDLQFQPTHTEQHDIDMTMNS